MVATWELALAHPAAAVAVVFFLDGLGVPLMPEVAVLLAYNLQPTPGWALTLLAVVVLMEVLATAVLYGAARWVGLPGRLERLLAAYSRTLLVKDERLLLLNRVVPVLPMAGAFIHVRGWRVPRSFAFVALGSLVKYGLILMVAGAAYRYFQDGTALAVGLSLASVFLLASWGVALRRWWAGRAAQAQA
jgi:hypothetical protein